MLNISLLISSFWIILPKYVKLFPPLSMRLTRSSKTGSNLTSSSTSLRKFPLFRWCKISTDPLKARFLSAIDWIMQTNQESRVSFTTTSSRLSWGRFLPDQLFPCHQVFWCYHVASTRRQYWPSHIVPMLSIKNIFQEQFTAEAVVCIGFFLSRWANYA